jgi:hypothetical protein
VNAPRLRIHGRLQRFGVGGAQLRELAPFEHFRRQIVLFGQVFENAGVGRPSAGFGFAAALQFQFVEQDFAELLG